MGESVEARIVEYGPYRLIGMSCVGSENTQFKKLWTGENGFLSRMGEVESLGDGTAYGLCRCVAGATDGSFEYIAAVPAKADAPVPEGMIEAHISAATYTVFTAQGLEKIGQTWGESHAWMQAHPEWQGYCDTNGCDCANYPAFELYPADCETTNTLFIYMPVRPKK